MTRAPRFKPDFDRNSESGVALLLAIFVISLATILVFEFGRRARFDQSVSRAFVDSIQSDYTLKSGMNVSRLLLKLPKDPNYPEDWLREPWATIGQLQKLPIDIVGDPRIAIVDDDAKIDINWIKPPASSTLPPATPGARLPYEIWRDALAKLFQMQGFVNESYDPKEYRTVGNVGLSADNQVAAIIDYIDKDNTSYQAPGFQGKGIESGVDKRIFKNAEINTLSELLLVPGMTLERLARIAPFVKVSNKSGGATKQININTVPLQTLLALEFPEADANTIVEQRLNVPFKTTDLKASLTPQDPTLYTKLAVSSREFSAYIRVGTASSTRWLHASLEVDISAGRKTTVNALEYY